jgi:putative transposase
MLVQARHVEDVGELQRRVRGERNAKQRDRYRAVLLALQGEQTKSIMEKLGRSRGFVQSWVYVYRDHGLDAIRESPRSGKPPKLSVAQFAALREHLDQGPDPSAGLSALRGPDVRRWLESQFGVTYSLSGAYELLHRLNYAPLRPRPHNPKQDAQAVEQWRRRAPLLSSKSENDILTGKSKSGSRMKADSDSKEP